MLDRFDRGRHDAVIRCDDEHHDIGHRRTTGTHGCEGFVTGGIQEGDRVVATLDGIGTHVLGDATGFARRDARLADRIEERGLAVIDMTHESDDRRTRLHLRRRDDHDLGRFDHLDRSVNLACAFFPLFDLEGEAELGAKLLGDVLFQGLGGAGENVHLHQVMDDLVRLQAELGREVLDDDRRLDDDDLVLELLGRDGGFVLDDGDGSRRGFWRLGRSGHNGRRCGIGR